MRTYRISIYSIAIFALAYPLISGSVLIRDWNGGVGEIYPIAPWALFCFVPNQEADFAIRFTALDGRSLDPPQYFEELTAFSQHEKTVGRGVIDGMGRLIDDGESDAFNERRMLFERNYLEPLAQEARYELVRREYDVLERWRTSETQNIESIADFVYRVE